MEYLIDNIKTDIQTVNVPDSPELIEYIEQEMRRVARFRQDIVAADFYLTEEGTNADVHKVVKWRLGIPGKDLFAEARSASWQSSLKEAGEKLRRQFVD